VEPPDDNIRDAVKDASNGALTVLEIAREGPWLGVVLGGETPSRDLLRRVRSAIVAVASPSDVEVRHGTAVHRGGAGFGDGRHVIAVLGGKGGVGKSTTAVNLALTLSAMGLKAGLLDCDINAPDIPHMLGAHLTVPPRTARSVGATNVEITPPSKRRRPHQRYSVEIMSVGLEVPERFAPRLTSRLLVSTLLRNLVFEVAWSADVLILDAPPGTGEELQVIARELPLSGALFVTTPQDLAQMDAERTLALLQEHVVPVIGAVKNMASMTCPHCDRDIDLYAQSDRLASAGVPVIGAVPFNIDLSVAADRGLPLVLSDPRGPIALEFARIGAHVRRWLAERPAHEPA
jgi:ATP-binding protein involved in chromosome partitioning